MLSLVFIFCSLFFLSFFIIQYQCLVYIIIIEKKKKKKVLLHTVIFGQLSQKVRTICVLSNSISNKSLDEKKGFTPYLDRKDCRIPDSFTI